MIEVTECYLENLQLIGFGIALPCVGSGVERIGPLRFLAGCRKSQLNQAVSVLSVSLGSFLSVSIVQLTRASSCVVLSCAICVFCLLVDLVCLSEPVQVIDWIKTCLRNDV